jgi:hypothetical protein
VADAVVDRICPRRGGRAIEGQASCENTTMLAMCRRLGFEVVPDATDTSICFVKRAV